MCVMTSNCCVVFFGIIVSAIFFSYEINNHKITLGMNSEIFKQSIYLQPNQILLASNTYNNGTTEYKY